MPAVRAVLNVDDGGGALTAAQRAEAVALVDEHGYLALPRLFAAARVEALARAVDAWLDAATPPSLKVGHRRQMIPVPLAPPLFDAALVTDGRLLAIVEALLGDDVILNSYTVVVAEAGAEAQAPHRDHGLLFGDELLGSALPPHALTLVVPLVDLDAATGTTALLGGTHRAGAETGEVALPYIAVGGAFLMDYRLTHYGTPNASPRRRPIVYIVYSRPWFVDEQNFARLPPLTVPAGAPPLEGRVAQLARRTRFVRRASP
jgi:hypothetical protein